MAIQHEQILPAHEIVHKPHLIGRVREHSHPARRAGRERHRHGAGVEFPDRLAARCVVEFVRLREDQVVVEQDGRGFGPAVQALGLVGNFSDAQDFAGRVARVELANGLFGAWDDAVG